MDRVIEVETEVTLKVRGKVHVWEEEYGADADGRRGEMRTFAESEGGYLPSLDLSEIEKALEDAAVEQEQD